MSRHVHSVWVWMDGSEDVSHAIEHSLDAYGGIVPSRGDRIVTEWPDGADSFEVVERYLVQGLDELVRWHIILQPMSMPPRRDYALHLTEEAKELQRRIVDERRKNSLEKTMMKHQSLAKPKMLPD